MSVFGNTLLVALALALVALNGFFVAAEFALVKLRQTQVQELAAARGWRGRILAKVHGRLDAYLSACQLGITLASLGLGWIGEPAFATLLEPLLTMLGITEIETVHTIAFVFAFSIISFLHIVVGELAPKTLALRRPERISLWTATPLYLFYWLMYPFIHVLNISASRLLKSAGLEGKGGHGNDSAYTHGELKTILHLSHASGSASEQGVNTLLRHTLELQELVASDLMRPRREMTVLHHDDSHAEVRRVVQKHRYSRYPVLGDDGEVVGLAHVKDLLLEPPGDDYSQRLQRLLRQIERVPETLAAPELLRRFRQGAPHFALVVDRDGSTEGFVTLEDVLEAILGEIADEHEPRRAGQVERRIVRLADGSLLLRGDTPVYRLERELGTVLAGSAEVDTVGGLLMQQLDRVALRGDSAEFGAYRIAAQRVQGPRIELVKVTLATESGVH
jgi:CBS domain containing-hemolysin-like protein